MEAQIERLKRFSIDLTPSGMAITPSGSFSTSVIDPDRVVPTASAEPKAFYLIVLNNFFILRSSNIERLMKLPSPNGLGRLQER